MPSQQSIDLFTRWLFEPESVNGEMLHQVLQEMGVSMDSYIKLMCQVQAEIALYKQKLLHQSPPQM